jgi:hypothetical protein
MFEMLNLFNFGYLDPGTGSLIVQSLIGVVAGVSVFGRNAISRFTGKTKRLLSKDSKPETKTE